MKSKNILCPCFSDYGDCLECKQILPRKDYLKTDFCTWLGGWETCDCGRKSKFYDVWNQTKEPSSRYHLVCK